MHAQKIKILSRILCYNDYGTVKWIGELPNSKELWLGIEWDDPNRGRHNGIFEGVQYFEVRFENSGSFIKLSKADLGVTFLYALKSRYCTSFDHFHNEEIISSFRKNINAPFVETVGFDKLQKIQSQLLNLQFISLRGQRIYGEDHPELIIKTCPNVKELDLSLNLLSTWESVSEIVEQLPLIESLNLSSNRLMLPSCPESLIPCFYSLLKIVLNNCNYKWEDIVICASMFPNITEMKLANNYITDLSLPSSLIFSKLRHLDLQGNALSWDNVEASLYSLPNLEYLNLRNTRLDKIEIIQPNKVFSKLSTLILSHNFINEWSSINELNKLPNLQHLTLEGNPLFVNIDLVKGRQKVIALLAKLQTFNHSVITTEERKTAEVCYVSEIEQQLMICFDKTHLLEMNPRYNELSKRTKVIPKTMKVSKLKRLVSHLLKIPSNKMSLDCQSHVNLEIVIPLDKDLQSLSYFDVSSGDKIIAQF